MREGGGRRRGKNREISGARDQYGGDAAGMERSSRLNRERELEAARELQ